MKPLTILALSAVIAFLRLGSPVGYGQQEIDPDHFDSLDTAPMPQPRTADSKVSVIPYHGTFSLPYSALCNGKELAPGKYSISLRSNGKVGQAIFNQKGHAVEIAAGVRTNGPKHHDEAVIVQNNKDRRTLSVIRVRGFDFVFDAQHSAVPSQNGTPNRAERLPLTTIAPRKTQAPAAAQASSKR